MTESWNEGLTQDQIRAVEHRGKHALILAGPGTGKTRTLTRHAFALVVKYKVPPDKILALTFTRVAAFQLRKELEAVLQPLGKGVPYVATLHSFALRQLLRNSELIAKLPKPLRIADDWEERNIVQEDLSADLGKGIREIQKQFNALSADWETLSFELTADQRMCRDAKFIGAWNEHRKLFGYSLRGELVYQLKRALNQYAKFKLESNFEHVLVDEYQDLNACDLKLIEELARRRCELYVAGDDDQSIYGFRHADPSGIRDFTKKYKATSLELEICHRCDKAILELGEFVANLDTKRLPKKIRPRPKSDSGEVRLYRFRDEMHEAQGVAKSCKKLISNNKGIVILILIRSDHNQLISKTLLEVMQKAKVPVAIQTDEGPLASNEARILLSVLRLLENRLDSLAWQALLLICTEGIAQGTFQSIRNLALEKNCTYAQVLMLIKDNPQLVKKGYIISKEVHRILTLLENFSRIQGPVLTQIHQIILLMPELSSTGSDLEKYLEKIVTETKAESMSDVLRAISVSMELAEQDIKPDCVNVMTMHKAKGLSADAVFIVGAEKQFIPGRNVGKKEGDERRLLYVSLTRAKHLLVITYCDKRVTQQRFTGSEIGKPERDLTPFLQNAPLEVISVN